MDQGCCGQGRPGCGLQGQVSYAPGHRLDFALPMQPLALYINMCALLASAWALGLLACDLCAQEIHCQRGVQDALRTLSGAQACTS